MPSTCVVRGCTSRSGCGVVKRGFFDLPTVITNQGSETERLSTQRRTLWLARINREGFNPDPKKRHFKVCSDHFITGKKAELYDPYNPDWAPLLKLEPVPKCPKMKQSSLKRSKRAKERKTKRERGESAAAPLALRWQDTASEEATDRETLTAPSQQSAGPHPDDSGLMKQMRAELQRLRTENTLLKEELKDLVLSPDSLRGNDAKVKYYTGVSYDILMTLYTCVEARIPQSALSTLTPFEMLIMVLMKLRLDLGQQDLAYRFSVSTSCVSKVFLDVVHVLFVRLRGLVLWPDRVDLLMSMPMEFRKDFGVKVSIIIDCFEVFIGKPSNDLTQTETLLNYKHHNTVKYLTGLTPQGVVCFLSKGWGGRASDQHVTENCGLLSLLRPGDMVLTDRGLDAPESVRLHCAEVKRPSSTRGKPQLSALQNESTRTMAHSRIHVERLIGLLRNKYTILRHTIPIDYLRCPDDCVSTLDKIVTVCCALSNLCGSVVPLD
ncbi:unnamed protein product [Knipowitschia caucasica]